MDLPLVDQYIPKYDTKDSGDRVEYDSGMVRDTNGGKPRWDLMIPKGVPYEELYLTRVARLYERGAQKYEPRNWEKARSEVELDRARESAFRHFMQWFAGETDEDHAAAVFFNINEVETIRYKQLPVNPPHLTRFDQDPRHVCDENCGKWGTA